MLLGLSLLDRLATGWKESSEESDSLHPPTTGDGPKMEDSPESEPAEGATG